MRTAFIIQISRYCLGDKIEAAPIVLLIYLIYFWFLLPNLIYVKVSWSRIHYVVKCNLTTFYWDTVIQSFLSLNPIISSYIIVHRSNHTRWNSKRKFRICGRDEIISQFLILWILSYIAITVLNILHYGYYIFSEEN